MDGLARLVGEAHPDIQIDVVAGGGVSNHERVGCGDVPMGILNPPMTAAALAGRRPYDRMHPALRIGVANLTTNYLHCFVEHALPVESVAAWLEQRRPLRMPVDRVGTVDRMVFQLALDHFGVAEADVQGWGGALVPANSYDEQLALYRAGAVNALWQFMAIPSPSIEAAGELRPLRPLPFAESLVATLEHLGWTPATLPEGAYGIVDRRIPTVSMGTSLGFHAGVADDVVYRIVRTICELGERVRRIHPAASGFDPAAAHRLSRGPLHAGAARYFREAGLLS